MKNRMKNKNFEITLKISFNHYCQDILDFERLVKERIPPVQKVKLKFLLQDLLEHIDVEFYKHKVKMEMKE